LCRFAADERATKVRRQTRLMCRTFKVASLWCRHFRNDDCQTRRQRHQDHGGFYVKFVAGECAIKIWMVDTSNVSRVNVASFLTPTFPKRRQTRHKRRLLREGFYVSSPRTNARQKHKRRLLREGFYVSSPQTNARQKPDDQHARCATAASFCRQHFRSDRKRVIKRVYFYTSSFGPTVHADLWRRTGPNVRRIGDFRN
jgi:hypothetical protein